MAILGQLCQLRGEMNVSKRLARDCAFYKVLGIASLISLSLGEVDIASLSDNALCPLTP